MKERNTKKDLRPRKDYEREKERTRRTREPGEANERFDETETTGYKNKGQEEKSLSASEQWWLRCIRYIPKPGDLAT